MKDTVTVKAMKDFFSHVYKERPDAEVMIEVGRGQFIKIKSIKYVPPQIAGADTFVIVAEQPDEKV